MLTCIFRLLDFCVSSNCEIFGTNTSHLEVETRFKLWIYKVGKQSLVHDEPVNNIYGVEGHFIDEMESRKSHFMAHPPNEAHVFFILDSIAKITNILYCALITY
ncbi:hypothetical protein TIFTF001_026081 [Ficus carica]|uniref:Uncharacterized protein n=1 Tax=Ficus carica TaxID=3494 RepID=A0AA88AXP3_FICCA|nr:hypothetical protein TIFTF001_026081 [Ficus carica]